MPSAKDFLAAAFLRLAAGSKNAPRLWKSGSTPAARPPGGSAPWRQALLEIAMRPWRRRRPRLLRNPDGTVLARYISEQRYCAALTNLAGVYWQAEELRELKTHNFITLSSCGKAGRLVMALIASRLARAEHYERTPDHHANDHDGAKSLHRPSSPDSLAALNQTLREAHWLRIAVRPCLICGATPSQPHPIGHRAVPVGEVLAVPLCVCHTNQLAAFGYEAAWWRIVGIDPLVCAQAMWQDTLICMSWPRPALSLLCQKIPYKT